MQNNLYTSLKDVKDIETARTTIKNSIPELETLVSSTTNDNNFTINYGTNYFPEKKLNGINYNDGNYESLVINLGESKGNNWWCILFPPLCLIEAEESEEIEYQFFLEEFIYNIFH